MKTSAGLKGGTRPPKAAVRKTDVILKLARTVIVRRKLSDADLNEARDSGLTDNEIAETVVSVMLNIFSNYANEVSQLTVTRREVPKTTRRGNTWPRIWSAIGCVTEFVVGAFAGLYVLAVLALGGAVLFFTFGY